MSLQVCHCGWSKVTTYHGLRTHQGKKGCTPKGMSVPQSQQFSYLPKMTLFPTPVHFDDPFCDIFQTPKIHGYFWTNQSQDSHQKDNTPVLSSLFKEKKALMSPNLITQTDENRKASDFTFDSQQVNMTPLSQVNPPAPQRPVSESNKSLFETPPLFQTSLEKARRRLDFTGTLKANKDKMRAELQQKIHLKEQKMAKVSSSVKSCQDGLDAEWIEINSVFSEVIKVVEDARRKALDPVERRRKEIKLEAEDLLDELQKGIDIHKYSIRELEERPDSQVSSPPDLDDSTHWENLDIDTSCNFGSLRATTSAMMKEIQQKLENLSSIELKRIPTFAVDVRLDPASAHQCLVLSEDGKNVRDGGERPKLPDAPERFDVFGSVLGVNVMTSGRSYWEVEVGDKTGWDLGVARRRANRKGVLSVNADEGYWAIVHYENRKYAALSVPPISLSLKRKPQKVGVFVDYRQGLVSFYDVTNQLHIHSFTECFFRDEIVPYFSPHLKQKDKNADPLIISAVQQAAMGK